MHCPLLRCVLLGTFLCLLAPPAFATPAGDVNCDGEVDVVDVQFSILLVLDHPINVQLDRDQDGVVDACPAPAICGDGTVLDAGTCAPLVTQAEVDAAYLEGAESVDITSDNQAAYDEGVEDSLINSLNDPDEYLHSADLT